jgi:hypothetical protein
VEGGGDATADICRQAVIVQRSQRAAQRNDIRADARPVGNESMAVPT